MAQCFISTYRNHYRHNRNVIRRAPLPPITFFPIPPEEFWIEQETEEELDPQVVQDLLYENTMKKYVTSYQVHYGRDSSMAASSENELMAYCKNLYEPTSKPKIAPPLQFTRKMFGYIRPTRNYTPMTTYQTLEGKTGYEILKGKGVKGPSAKAGNVEEPKKKKEKTKNPVNCQCGL